MPFHKFPGSGCCVQDGLVGRTAGAREVAWLPFDAPRPQRVIPFTTFLLKVASRCNLDCDYCYMYHLADQSWRRRPKIMQEGVVERTLERISEHAKSHGLSQVTIVFHGGEPLLAGPAWFRLATDLAARCLAGVCGVTFGVQTNATLLDEAFVELFIERNVRVSISLDGDRRANDIHRRDHNGRSSYEAAVRGIELLSTEEGRRIFGGMLTVVDLRNDPLAVYRHLNSFRSPSIDFLLPDGNHAHRPPGLKGSATAYADWLIPIFDEWYQTSDGTTVIRWFQEIIQMLLGAPSGLESLGLGPVDLVVVETDGEIEAVDSLKSTFHGAASLGADVFANRFDDVLGHPAIYSRHLGISGLSSACQTCGLVSICGGGYQPHRYATESGFVNPSVYCADLMKVIDHIASRVRRDLQRVVVSSRASRGAPSL